MQRPQKCWVFFQAENRATSHTINFRRFRLEFGFSKSCNYKHCLGFENLTFLEGPFVIIVLNDQRLFKIVNCNF